MTAESKRITYFRELANLTQADLARACEVSPSTVCLWEKGDRRPGGESLDKIASACGIELRIFWADLPEAANG